MRLFVVAAAVVYCTSKKVLRAIAGCFPWNVSVVLLNYSHVGQATNFKQKKIRFKHSSKKAKRIESILLRNEKMKIQPIVFSYSNQYASWLSVSLRLQPFSDEFFNSVFTVI